MKVRDLLRAKPKRLVTAQKTTDLLSAMNLLIGNKISCLLISDDGETLCGIVSDKDIFKAVHDNHDTFSSLKIRDVMSTDVIVGVDTDDLNYIAGLMTNNRIRHIPIVEGSKLTGLVSIGDVVKAQMDDIKIENRYLKQYIDGAYPC